jgi:hypothetical protein
MDEGGLHILCKWGEDALRTGEWDLIRHTLRVVIKLTDRFPLQKMQQAGMLTVLKKIAESTAADWGMRELANAVLTLHGESVVLPQVIARYHPCHTLNNSAPDLLEHLPFCKRRLFLAFSTPPH